MLTLKKKNKLIYCSTSSTNYTFLSEKESKHENLKKAGNPQMYTVNGD